MVPRHQALGERGHMVVMTNHLILMNQLVEAFPQEWPSLLPALEYLYETAPQGPHGLSAHDMSTGFALARSVDTKLTPFMVPKGLPETDVAARLFTTWRELYGAFQRITQEQSMRAQLRLNKTRVHRQFEPGELVYRKVPREARLPKHLFPDPSSGPYQVFDQPSNTSVILHDMKGNLVDGGKWIPLDQIVTGPRRAGVVFQEETAVRPWSEMIRGRQTLTGSTGGGPAEADAGGGDGGAGGETGATGTADRGPLVAGRRKGWSSLAPGAHVAYQDVAHGPRSKELIVCKVIAHDKSHRQGQQVIVQPHQGVWRLVRLVHLPQYQTPDAYSTTVTSAPEAREAVRYEALVLQVELLRGGELAYGSARTLSNRGWGLHMDLEERVAGLRESARLYQSWPPGGMYTRRGEDGSASGLASTTGAITGGHEQGTLSVKILDSRVRRHAQHRPCKGSGFSLGISPLGTGVIPAGGTKCLRTGLVIAAPESAAVCLQGVRTMWHDLGLVVQPAEVPASHRDELRFVVHNLDFERPFKYTGAEVLAILHDSRTRVPGDPGGEGVARAGRPRELRRCSGSYQNRP